MARWFGWVCAVAVLVLHGGCEPDKRIGTISMTPTEVQAEPGASVPFEVSLAGWDLPVPTYDATITVGETYKRPGGYHVTVPTTPGTYTLTVFVTTHPEIKVTATITVGHEDVDSPIRWRTGNHEGAITDMIYSHGGDRLATVGDDKTVRVWTADEGSLVGVIADPNGPTHVSWGPDDKQLAIGDGAGWAVLDIAEGKLVRQLAGAGGTRPVFSPDGKLLVTVGPGLKGWDLATDAPVFDRPEYTGSDLTFAPDGSFFTLQNGLHDPKYGTHLREVGYGKMVWMPDSKQVLSAGGDPLANGGLALIFTDPVSGQRITDRGIPLPTSPILSLTYNHARRLAAVLVKQTSGFRIMVLEVDAPSGVFWELGELEHVELIAWSPDGDRLSVAGGPSDDGTVRVHHLDAETGEPAGATETTGTVLGAAFSPDGATVAAAEDNDRIWLRDSVTGEPKWTVSTPAGPLRFSSDGSSIAVLSGELEVTTLEAATGTTKTTVTLAALEPEASAVAVSPGLGKVAGFATAFGKLLNPVVWDAETGAHIVDLECPSPRVVAWMPDDTRLVVLGAKVMACDAATGALVWEDVVAGKQLALAVTADGSRIATGGLIGDGPGGAFWELRSHNDGTLIATHTTDAAVKGLAWIGDNRLLVDVGTQFELWDVNGAKRLESFAIENSGGHFDVSHDAVLVVRGASILVSDLP